MDNNENILTEQGRQELLDELAWREGEKNAEIIKRLKEARDFGDLSENSEFDDAKEEQSQNAARIAEIRKVLATAKIVDSATAGKGPSVVSVGGTVEVEDAKGKKQTFTIVGTTEAKSLEHMISNESPLGAALLGHKKGDEVEFMTPSGKKRKVTITKITRAKK